MNIIQSKAPKIKIPSIFENSTENKESDLPIYNVCFIGHVDHGKSTTVGRILHLCGRVKQHVIDTYTEQAKLMQKNTFQYAWCLDSTPLERQKGVTIDVTHVEFNTEDRYFTMVDCPGHSDFIKNAITGISQADLAVLCLDAKRGVETTTNTREHVIVARASGINSIIVALTKVDTIPLAQRMNVLKERTEEVKTLLKGMGYTENRMLIVPINSFDGWNLIDRSFNEKELPGYEGPTLIEALNSIEMDPIASNYPLRMSVEGICTKVSGTNCVLTGKVLSGTLNLKDKIVIKPGNLVGQVRKLQMHHQNVTSAPTNTNIGVDITGIDAKKVKRAAIVSLITSPAKLVSEFTAQKTVLMDHPSKLTVGSNLIAHYQTGNVAVSIKAISDVYDLRTYRGDFQEHLPERKGNIVDGFTRGPVNTVAPGSLACITFVPDKPIVVETIEEHPKLCNIILRDVGKTLGWAKITSKVLHALERT